MFYGGGACPRHPWLPLLPSPPLPRHSWFGMDKSSVLLYFHLSYSFHRYLNDLYVIDIRSSNNLQWEMPTTVGMTPSPRESHTCVATSDSDSKRHRLIVYGGMSGCRLGDLHQLDIGM